MSNTSVPALTPSTITSLTEDLKRDEGCKNRPYRDSRGVNTIGYGHNLDAEGLCPAALEAQLQFDIATKALPLLDHLPWLTSRPPEVQRVLLNMAFNLGVGGLLKFGTFLNLIHDEEYEAAARDLLSTPYAAQVKMRALRLAGLLQSVVK